MSRPLGSTPTPASRSFAATTGRSASERRIGTQCLRFLPRHAPSRDQGAQPPPISTGRQHRRSPSHVPHESRRPSSRRLRAGRHLASNSGNRQTHPRSESKTPGFDATYVLTALQQRHPKGHHDPPDALERLLGPHLIRSSRTSSLTLTTTVFSQRSPGWFDANPRKADAGGPTNPPSLAQHRF